jgi:hypothetical protein
MPTLTQRLNELEVRLEAVEIPVVDALSRIPASKEREGKLVRVAAVPGTSASILYVCLGDDASTTAYSWVTVATG